MGLTKCHCGKPVVNKKYGLCDEHNYIRINGRSKREVYSERERERNETRRSSYPSQRKLEKRKPIKKISSKKRERDARMHDTYEMIDLSRDVRSCEGCGLNLPLSHSHLLSQKNREDLADDELNIRLHCFGGYRRCHETWERGKPIEIVKMKDFHDNMLYIKHADSDRHSAIVAKFDFDKVELNKELR